ncbi:MAG: SWIM zinc finger family protein [Methanoregula sp.]
MTDQERTDPFHDLDWATLEAWAGAKTLSRGKEYQRGRKVNSLARSRDGTLVAWVDGSKRYATAITFDNGLVSECTCPVGISCKHAVAVVLEYLDLCGKNSPVPSLTPHDPRITLLGLRSEPVPAQDPSGTHTSTKPALSPFPDENSGKPRKKTGTPRQYLEAMKKEELIGFIEELMEIIPEVAQEISDRIAVADADPRPVFEDLLADIDAITEEEAWSDSWRGDPQVPDYSPVRKRMEMLLAMDRPDMVIDAGSILLKNGIEQLETGGDDEGETAGEIGSCMDLVFTALSKSSRPAHERLLFAIRAVLDDEFDLCGDARSFLDGEWPAAEWSLVADQLLRELDLYRITPGKDNFSERYRRDAITCRIMTALDNAGRTDEATSLSIAETGLTDSYARLVRRLLSLGKNDEAAAWILRGIEATKKTRPGIAHELQAIQRDVWEKEGDLPAVAGLRAEEFLCDPSYRSLCQLQAAAEKAGVWDTVKDPVMQYLTSGSVPARKREGGVENPLIFGALPRSGLIVPDLWKSQETPYFTILIEHAVANRKPEEAVMWFDRLREEQKGFWGYSYPEDKLWDAAADRFPDRALQFWMGCADREAQTAQPKGYANAIGYLKKIRALMGTLGRKDEWAAYLAGVREVHARKKKFTGMLDIMEGQKILKS